MAPEQRPIPVHEVNLGAGILAFFTQNSRGVSPPPWQSLNLGANVGDDNARVLANRDLVANRMGKPVRFAHQVHSNEVINLFELADDVEVACGEADALVTAASDFGLGVLVADCVPILLADPHAKVVAAAHAGRAGLLNGVISNVITAMVSRGAKTSRMTAAVGPCICETCYEVPAQMAHSFAKVTGTPPSRTRWQTEGLDLRGAAHGQLMAAGLTDVEHVLECTYESERQFSHRRATKEGTATGRTAGIIGLF